MIIEKLKEKCSDWIEEGQEYHDIKKKLRSQGVGDSLMKEILARRKFGELGKFRKVSNKKKISAKFNYFWVQIKVYNAPNYSQIQEMY